MFWGRVLAPFKKKGPLKRVPRGGSEKGGFQKVLRTPLRTPPLESTPP